MTSLSEDEKILLRQILADKYSVGSWCGMIFNGCVASDASNPAYIEELMKRALQIRLLAQELSK